MSKYYFQTDNAANCYELSYFYDYMKMNGIEEMELIEAQRIYDHEYFWCKEYHDLAEKGDCSVSNCKSYVPNNGKNGRCKHYGYFYGKSDKKKTIKLCN